MKPPISLIESWLNLCHGALCRQAHGALFVHLPIGSELSLVAPGERSTRALVVVVHDGDRAEIEAEARRLFGEDWILAVVVDDLRTPSSETAPHFSLRRALSELQTYLLDAGSHVPAEAEQIAFLLKHGEYRSRHISVRRVAYHVVPHEGAWKVKRQGQDEGEIYSLKDKAIKAGADRARTHAAGQLIIHNADGTFEEERTYGNDPTYTSG